MISTNFLTFCILVAAGVAAYPIPDDIPGTEGHDYVYYGINVNFTDAIKLCQEQGMNLVTLNGNSENAGISIAMSNGKVDRVWVGLIGINENFAVDLQGKQLDASFWALNNPDTSGDAFCGSFTDRSAELIHCNNKLPVICEYNKNCDKV